MALDEFRHDKWKDSIKTIAVYQTLFSLEEGDKILLKTGDHEYTYPHEIVDLDINSGETTEIIARVKTTYPSVRSRYDAVSVIESITGKGTVFYSEKDETSKKRVKSIEKFIEKEEEHEDEEEEERKTESESRLWSVKARELYESLPNLSVGDEIYITTSQQDYTSPFEILDIKYTEWVNEEYENWCSLYLELVTTHEPAKAIGAKRVVRGIEGGLTKPILESLEDGLMDYGVSMDKDINREVVTYTKSEGRCRNILPVTGVKISIEA